MPTKRQARLTSNLANELIIYDDPLRLLQPCYAFESFGVQVAYQSKMKTGDEVLDRNSSARIWP